MSTTAFVLVYPKKYGSYGETPENERGNYVLPLDVRDYIQWNYGLDSKVKFSLAEIEMDAEKAKNKMYFDIFRDAVKFTNKENVVVNVTVNGEEVKEEETENTETENEEVCDYEEMNVFESYDWFNEWFNDNYVAMKLKSILDFIMSQNKFYCSMDNDLVIEFISDWGSQFDLIKKEHVEDSEEKITTEDTIINATIGDIDEKMRHINHACRMIENLIYSGVFITEIKDILATNVERIDNARKHILDKIEQAVAK